MNDEPKETEGPDPGANPSARTTATARGPTRQDGNVSQPGEQGGNTRPAVSAGEATKATNGQSAIPSRKVAARAGTPAPGARTSPAATDTPGQQQEQAQQEQEGSLKDVTIAGQMIINTVTEYAQIMKPGRVITQAEGMRQQVSLCNAVFAAINTLDADFRSVLTAILGILHRERDTAFRETHLFRYWDSVALSKNQRRGFEKIITLLKTLADPKTRQTALRQVDFERLMQYGLTEKGRTRLAAYFGK
ncbi:hypothetical protein HDG34_003331 [Paraburkholderia sp. HC6.4b]|uniref:hypothetical protein n=1 Tax=unclassified Paraburkholderia TaxID=2615204 RepID=UPI00160C4B3F|nr:MULTISPECIES: hypothetical protein [unclassified Paraburkholderia]MBB5409390.1 hypothetical protein [Paraburkholderia sp. HC6.4b]MBB5451119.1 hypothetical protein [Paraburkholderia sp. Kb1A]